MTTTTTLGKACDTSNFEKINKITIGIQKVYCFNRLTYDGSATRFVISATFLNGVIDSHGGILTVPFLLITCRFPYCATHVGMPTMTCHFGDAQQVG